MKRRDTNEAVEESQTVYDTDVWSNRVSFVLDM